MMGRIWAQVQPVRVGQPQELSRRAAGVGESVHSVELAVVHYRILDAARFGYRTEVSPFIASGGYNSANDKTENQRLLIQLVINDKN